MSRFCNHERFMFAIRSVRASGRLRRPTTSNTLGASETLRLALILRALFFSVISSCLRVLSRSTGNRSHRDAVVRLAGLKGLRYDYDDCATTTTTALLKGLRYDYDDQRHAPTTEGMPMYSVGVLEPIQPSTTSRMAGSIDVAQILDDGRVGGYQRWLVVLTALALIFDGIDNNLLGVAIPAISADWHVTRSAFSLVVSLNSFGMMIGGAVAGFIGDRLGRRIALIASLALFGITTVAVALVDGPRSLAVLRLLIGLGLGGAIPNATTLAAEYVPMRQRPLAVTLTIVCIPLGGTLAGLVAIPALPAIGWRGLFAAGGIAPIAVAVLLARMLPESPRFLARHPARHAELARVLGRMGHTVPPAATFASARETHARPSIAPLFARDMRADTCALWTAFASCLLAIYLGFSWLPSMLAAAGLGQAAASASLTVFNLGGVPSAVVGGWAIARFGSRTAMLVANAAAIASALTLSAMDISAHASVASILVMLAITGGLTNAVQVTMYALAAHIYPTVVRSTGVGAAVAIGRSGAILSGVAGPLALDYRGSASFFWLMAATLGVTFVAVAFVRRHIPSPTAATSTNTEDTETPGAHGDR